MCSIEWVLAIQKSRFQMVITKQEMQTLALSERNCCFSTQISVQCKLVLTGLPQHSSMQNIKVRHRKIFLYAFLVERIFCLLLVQLGPNYWCFIHPTWREFLRTALSAVLSPPQHQCYKQEQYIQVLWWRTTQNKPWRHVIHSRPEWRSW